MSAQTQTSSNPKTGSATLAASACVLGGLIVLAGTGVFDPPAMAEMVTDAGSYRMMTTEGNSAEFLAVVDNRTEQLMIYTITPQGSFELQIRRGMPELFRAARARVGLP